jgi:hypothetical protein
MKFSMCDHRAKVAITCLDVFEALMQDLQKHIPQHFRVNPPHDLCREAITRGNYSFAISWVHSDSIPARTPWTPKQIKWVKLVSTDNDQHRSFLDRALQQGIGNDQE